MTPVQFALVVAHRLRLVWRRTLRLRTRGVKAVVLRGDAVLLIRHSYHASDRYMLPGGGRDRGETASEAGIREVMEEAGCAITGVREHGCFVSHSDGWPNEIIVVVGQTTDEPRADGRELLEARFFPLDALPPALTDASRRRIIEVRDGLPPAAEW